MIKYSMRLRNHAMNKYRGMEVELHKFLTPARGGDKSSSSRLVGFTPGKRQRLKWTLWRSCEEGESLLHLPGIERWLVDKRACSLIYIPTELSWGPWEDIKHPLFHMDESSRLLRNAATYLQHCKYSSTGNNLPNVLWQGTKTASKTGGRTACQRALQKNDDKL